MAIVQPPIKYIELADGQHEIYDDYARKRLEGLSTVYSISCEYAYASGDTFVDWDDGTDITYDTMAIRNASFKSTAEDITISAIADKTSYIVLTSTKSANKYYAKKMTEMQIGDTVYVIEEAKTASDRWLSAFTASPLSATFKALNEKIDLSEYAKKTEAGKAGTYTSAAPSVNVTSSAGDQTATGTATVTYSKAATATGSAGGETITTSAAGATGTSANTGNAGGATVSGSNFAFSGTAATISVEADAALIDDHSYTPAGTISNSYTAAGTTPVVQSVSAELASAPAFTGTAATISVSGAYTPEGTIDVAVDDHTYTPAGTISKPDITLTTSAATVVTSAATVTGEAGAHTHSVSVSGDISLGDLTVQPAEGTATYTPAGSISAVSAAAHSHAVNAATDTFTAVTSITGFSGGSASGTFNTDAIKDVTLSASDTSTDGPAYIADVEHTAASLTGTTTFATGISGTKNFGFVESQSSVMTAPTVSAAGVLSWTTVAAAIQDEHTATTATIGISGGSISKTTKYMKKTTTAASTANVSWTPASLGTQNMGTITYVKSATLSTAGGFNITPTFTGTGVRLTAAAGTVTGSMTGTATSAGAHTHSIAAASTTSINNVTAAALAAAPAFTGTKATLSHTVGTKTFTGTSATLSLSASYTPAGTINKPNITVTAPTVNVNTNAIKAVTSTFAGTAATIAHSFTDATVTAEMSGAYTPAGTITGSQTISAHSHSYTAPADHTHSVTTTAHTHSITLSDATASGTASVAVAAHTHDLGNHTHGVTIPSVA